MERAVLLTYLIFAWFNDKATIHDIKRAWKNQLDYEITIKKRDNS